MPHWVIRILWLLYSVLFIYLAKMAILDDIALDYPLPVTSLVALSYLLTACGIGFHALDLRSQPGLVAKWRRIFPFLLLPPLMAVVMDAFLPEDYSLLTDGLRWVRGLLLIVILVGPAYYANYRFAFKKS